MQDIQQNLEAGTRVAAVNFQSANKSFSEYMLGELLSALTNSRKLDVVTRQEIEHVIKEQNFNASGHVSDESAQKIGHLLGAQIIVTGSFLEETGSTYRLLVNAITVEEGVHKASKRISVSRADKQVILYFPEGGVLDPGAWKHKRLYLGLRSGYSLHNYVLNTTADIQADSHSTFEAAALAEVQLWHFFALQTEMVFSTDTVAVNGNYGALSISSRTLAVPLLAKFTWRPGNFYLAAFGGPNVALPLGPLELKEDGVTSRYGFKPNFGLTAGANAGIRLGQGVLFLDLRYSGDLMFVRSEGEGQYRRNIFSVSVGYSFGLIDK
ncbi:outer membrane beta-barrel protein [Breznakiellaceae bacterium SP9]